MLLSPVVVAFAVFVAAEFLVAADAFEVFDLLGHHAEGVKFALI